MESVSECLDCEKKIGYRHLRCGSCASRLRISLLREKGISLGFKKGHIGTNKGLKLKFYFCLDCKKALSCIGRLRCRSCYAKTRIGKKPYIITKEIREKMSLSQTGKVSWNKGKKLPQFSGENHPNWQGGITTIGKTQRIKFQREMQKLILERDNYTCQMCKAHGVDLQVDHIQPWAEYVELRFNMDNCRTLCKSCHYQITFGRPIPDKNLQWGNNLGKARVSS